MSRVTNELIWAWLGGRLPTRPIWMDALERRKLRGLAALTPSRRRDICKTAGLAAAAKRKAAKEAKVA